MATPEMVTARDVAERCGFSKSTVQRALGGYAHLLKPDTAARIRAVAEEMGYDPTYHDAARRLAFRKHGKQPATQTIVLLMPNGFHGNTYFPTIFNGIVGRLADQHYDLVTRFVNHKELPAEQTPLPNCVVRGEVDAAIFFSPGNLDTTLVNRFRAQPHFGTRPLVSLLIPAPDTSSVVADDREGAYQAADHLLDLGHRALLHFYSPTVVQMSYHAAERYAGYAKACTERGLDPLQCLFSAPIDLGQPLPERMVNAVMQAIDERWCFTAILAPNDPLAVPIAQALQRRGVRVPEDVSIIGFDDTEPLLNEQQQNTLTTVRLPLDELGSQAAQLAIDRANGSILEDQQITLPVTLVVRGSTARPRLTALT
ncbi:MAG: LacI family DNA-binding transcriptional regulator [Armatimonadota bacterium]